MPELPEVESIRIQLEKFLLKHKIERVEIGTLGIIEGNLKKVVGASFSAVRRFGKVLSLDLSNKYSVIAHVKLTGQFIYRGPNLPNPPAMSKKVTDGLGGKHTHVIFHLNNNGKLFYNDVRKFGWIKIIKTSDVKTGFIGKLGPEPLDDLTLKKFKEILSLTKRAIKVLLMDQSKIGGVGNIYANDALWLSKIDPRRSANSLLDTETGILYKSIEKVLKEGLKRGGASELSFVTPDGAEGNYQKHFLVYGQDGKLCTRCEKNKIKKIILGGRGTYFCPICQK